jgi:hypothetical protein
MAHARETGLINVETLAAQGEKTRVPVYQLELDGNIIKKFNSVGEADSEINGSSGNISAICSSYTNDKDSGSRYSSAGFGWCYVRDYTTPKINGFFKKMFPELEGKEGLDFSKIRKYIDSGSRPVLQIDIDGSRIKLWESCQDAQAEIPNATVTNIWLSMQSNMTKLAGKFYWQQASYNDIISSENTYIKVIPKPIRLALCIPEESQTLLRPEIVHLLRENIGEDGSLYIKTRPIIQMTIAGEFIRNWPSATKARHALNLGRNNIEEALKGNQKTAFGYKWRYMTLEELCINDDIIAHIS